ncbi:MAG: ribonuclease III, partial [Actinobacteria bacterium]|nr:ribonuclease III [Actinomycetota bacterium]
LGYSFTDTSLAQAAIMHPSALDDGDFEYSYERLEFLGDSLVGLYTAEEIYRRFPLLDEGKMTRIKVALVSGISLAAISTSLGISDVIVFGGSEKGTGKRGLQSALENVYESIVAALYLDGGDEVARTWVIGTLGPHISEDYALEAENPKSLLQEVLQANRITPSYEVVAVDGPPHDRTFTSNVVADGEVLGTGQGRSKKDAEANAANDALSKL